jgi:hypothetical protein
MEQIYFVYEKGMSFGGQGQNATVWIPFNTQVEIYHCNSIKKWSLKDVIQSWIYAFSAGVK